MREEYTVSLRKTNQLYSSKAFAHPFCINLALTKCKALVWCWEVITEVYGVALAPEELQSRNVQKEPAIKAVFHLLLSSLT